MFILLMMFRGILELLIQDPEGSNFKLYTCFGLWPEHVGFVFALKWQNPLSLPPAPWFCSVHLELSTFLFY